MDTPEINWGPDLAETELFLVGALRIQGLEHVVGCLYRAVERVAAEGGRVSVDDVEALGLLPEVGR